MLVIDELYQIVRTTEDFYDTALNESNDARNCTKASPRRQTRKVCLKRNRVKLVSGQTTGPSGHSLRQVRPPAFRAIFAGFGRTLEAQAIVLSDGLAIDRILSQ